MEMKDGQLLFLSGCSIVSYLCFLMKKSLWFFSISGVKTYQVRLGYRPLFPRISSTRARRHPGPGISCFNHRDRYYRVTGDREN